LRLEPCGAFAVSGRGGSGPIGISHDTRFRDASGANVIEALKTECLRQRQLKAGEDLFGPGSRQNAIFVLIEGWVLLYTLLEDGKRQILHFAVADTLLGLPPSKGTVATFGVQALTRAVVAEIPHRRVRELVAERPDFALALAQSMARDTDLAFDLLTSIGRSPARVRVARLLLQLFVRAWSRLPGHGIEAVRLPLTQEQLGDATGLSSVHVNRVLHELKREGIAAFHYRRLRILDPDRLIDAAEIDPETLKSWIV